MTGPASKPKKFPWELHLIVCIQLLLLGFAVHKHPWNFDREDSVIGMVGLAIGIIGLFRGNQVSWWALCFAFVILATLATYGSIELIRKYGFRWHPLLLDSHLVAAACIATFGLLVACRIRGAFPAPTAPPVEVAGALRTILAVFAPILFIVAAVASIMVVALFSSRRGYNERSSSTSLKTLTSAEADFRANDRDWNHVNDFWTGDVAGLYCIVPKEGDGRMIKLIELSIAAADSDPLKSAYPPLPATPANKAGYWYQALNNDRSETPPELLRGPGRTFHTSSFGFVAYPDDYIGGSPYAFIVNANNTVFRRKLTDDVRTGDGPMKTPGFTDFPDDVELKKNWAKLD